MTAGAYTAIVCPGQGSQHRGMLGTVPDPTVLARLLDAAEALADIDLRGMAQLADAEDLADTRTTQPLLYLADWCWGSALIAAGVEPVAVAGHSLGEYAALALAGVFSVEAGLELVVERSALMASAASMNPGTMSAALGLDPLEVLGIVEEIDGAWLANDNCPGQTVISGTKEGVTAAGHALVEAGARRMVPLAVNGGFHSPLMGDAAQAFRETLSAAHFSDATIPIVQNTSPDRLVTSAADIRSNLIEQMTSTVGWTETMFTMRRIGVSTLIEAGPGSVLKGLARRMDGLTAVAAEDAGVEGVLEEVGMI